VPNFTHGLIGHPQSSGLDFCFGVSALLSGIAMSQLRIGAMIPKPWPYRPLDNHFSHLSDSLRHVVFKLVRAAAVYADNASAFSRAVLALQPDNGNRQLDLSIHLDSVVVYLRMIPDIVAAATPYLYENGGTMAGRSFRDHVEWFRKPKNARVDPAYSALVSAHGEWFEMLAGKDKKKGVRDLLIHRFGRFQYPVTTAPAELAGEVGADLVTTGAYVTDANQVLRRAADGMFAFLDAYVIHHSQRIATSAGWTPVDHAGVRAGYFMTLERTTSTTWLFPERRRAGRDA
jgi:hypothetical protein